MITIITNSTGQEGCGNYWMDDEFYLLCINVIVASDNTLTMLLSSVHCFYTGQTFLLKVLSEALFSLKTL